MKYFSRYSTDYKKKYGKVPVWIVDNANRLAEKHPHILDRLQDYARDATDSKEAVVVFVSSEGRVPRRMKGKSVMCDSLF